MVFSLTLGVELALSLLLAATLVYCSVLERRLKAVREGQEHLKSTIGDLNASLARAGASLRALETAAATVGETLDRKTATARATIDELSVLNTSGERIAERMERSVSTRPASRPAAAGLPSGSIMARLDTLKAAAR